MAVELVNLQDIVRKLVDSLYEKRHAPVPGAILMPALVSDLKASDGSVDAKALLRSFGFRNFASFVQQIPEIVFQRQAGSDFLVSPSGTTDVLKVFARPSLRLRHDFWKAFIEFPSPNTIRVYDVSADQILHRPVNSAPSGPVIEPISQEVQLEWRRRFAAEAPEGVRNELVAVLNQGGRLAFNDFARFIREHPDTGKAWSRYIQTLVAEAVEKWASANNVSSGVWEASASVESKSAPLSRRAEIYELLNRIPIEEVLKLTVPLEWLITISRER